MPQGRSELMKPDPQSAAAARKLTRWLALRGQLYGPGCLQAPDSFPSALSSHLRERQEMRAALLDDGQDRALVLTMIQRGISIMPSLSIGSVLFRRPKGSRGASIEKR